jgi:hypothetical protein
MPGERKKQFDAAYAVAEYLTVKRIRKRLDLIKHLRIRSANPYDPFPAVTRAITGKEVNTDLVENYWNSNLTDTLGIGSHAVKAALVIQTIIRGYLYLKQLRDSWKVGASNDERTVLIQSAVTRWKVRRSVLQLARDKAQIERNFNEFCRIMRSTGMMVSMFGRKYGNLERRRIRFNNEMTDLIYDVGKFNRRYVPLTQIYHAQKGSSGYPYGDARPTKKSYCFHLIQLGGRRYDFECDALADCNFLVRGFQRLIMLVYSAAPFYIDKYGIPRRAGSSVVNSALSKSFVGKKGSRSSADLLRFREAVKALKLEYNDWQRKYEKEREVSMQLHTHRVIELVRCGRF